MIVRIDQQRSAAEALHRRQRQHAKQPALCRM